MLKKTLFQFHWFLGITAGLILSLMGITGAIYSYDQQILKLINPKTYTVIQQDIPKLTPDQIYQKFSEKYQINNITLYKDPTTSSIINVKKEGSRKGNNIYINPYTAEILPPVKGQEFFKFILDFHRYLTLGEVGKQITGFCAFTLMFFLLSGLYLRWPKKSSFKQWFFIKPKLKGRNFLWDLHAVAGTWVFIFYLMFCLTGLFWSYDWWRNGMFNVLQVKKTPPIKEVSIPLPAEITTRTLSLAWQNFHSDYSSITFNMPKSTSIDLSYVDPTPQNERAKNTLTFNIQTQKFEKVTLYQDKKFNEKIMNSMLPVHRGSFFGPVWHFMAMLSALCMPLFFVTGWMLYLKRKKQKRLVQKAQVSLTTYQDADTWHIIYASQTGTAEKIAWETTQHLQQAKLNVVTTPLHQANLSDIKNALFIVSTYGIGEPPDSARNFANKMANIDLSHLNYAILALGSHDYPATFCAFGHTLDQWLTQNKAKSFFKLIELDQEQWNNQLSLILNTQFNVIDSQPIFDTWQIKHKALINPNSVGQDIYTLQLTPTSDELWQAGDIAQIQPENSAEDIRHFISQNNLDPNLFNTLKTCQLISNVAVEDLPTLPIREYSIASIPEQGFLQLVVRLQQNGIGSSWLCLHSESHIQMRIRTNENFHLIQDNRPIIMIGNGTGISSLLSLLETRSQLGYHQNWLIFGERHEKYDFLFKEKLLNWQQTGVLTHLDTAFSRDSGQYVQDKLIEQQTRLKEWIDNQAVIYVCGSINGMASGVDQALIHILGTDTVNQLREQNRYKRDVY